MFFFKFSNDNAKPDTNTAGTTPIIPDATPPVIPPVVETIPPVADEPAKTGLPVETSPSDTPPVDDKKAGMEQEISVPVLPVVEEHHKPGFDANAHMHNQLVEHHIPTDWHPDEHEVNHFLDSRPEYKVDTDNMGFITPDSYNATVLEVSKCANDGTYTPQFKEGGEVRGEAKPAGYRFRDKILKTKGGVKIYIKPTKSEVEKAEEAGKVGKGKVIHFEKKIEKADKELEKDLKKEAKKAKGKKGRPKKEKGGGVGKGYHKFKEGTKVKVDEAYLKDEASGGKATATAIVMSEPSDDEELVQIKYTNGTTDNLGQEWLEVVSKAAKGKKAKAEKAAKPAKEKKAKGKPNASFAEAIKLAKEIKKEKPELVWKHCVKEAWAKIKAEKA